MLVFEALGDQAVRVTDPEALDFRGLASRLERDGFAGFREAVPGMESVVVYFDARRVDFAAVCDHLAGLTPEPASARRVRRVTLPVCYGGACGPDVEAIAAASGLTPDEVVALHAGAAYEVAMLGFAPGFPYMTGLAPRLATPRLRTPRPLVPAGSVAVADAMTGIYPLAMPGGWNLVGRTPVRLFDPSAEPPALLSPGDRVCFVPVSLGEYQEIEAQVADGAYRVVVEGVE